MKKSNLSKLSCLLGAALMISPTGVYLFWGNLSMYTSSYFLAADVKESDIQTPWLVSAFLLAWAVVVPASGYLALIIDRRTLLFLSLVIYNISIASCYFIIDISFSMFTITMGLFTGIGSGLSHGLLIESAAELTETKVGIFSTIVENCMNVGSAIINQFITMYVNPNYLTSDWTIGSNKYFSQVEVIRRIPRLYLNLGMASAAVQLIGFFLILCHSFTQPEVATSVQETLSIKPSTSGKELSLNEDDEKKRSTVSCEPTLTQSLKIWLTSKKFYALWFSCFICEASTLGMYIYYKQIGRTGIKDEHFLTMTGTVNLLFMTLISLGYGIFIDKYGVKLTLTTIFAVLTVTSSFYVLTPMAGKWTYFTFTVMFFGWGCALDHIMGAALISVFGHAHFTINFGLVWSSAFILNLFAPMTFAFMTENIGWSFMFISFALFDFLGLVFVLTTL